MSLDVDVLIIGAGMSGLGTAVQLRRHRLTSRIEIIEKCHDVGGTWLVNTYPGCGCDVASHFYSYSFALNPSWSQKFSMRTEIQQYFRNVAAQYDVHRLVRFGCVVERARWRDEEQMWEVEVKDLASKAVSVRRCRILVSAVGSLSIPRECEIEGAKAFQGRLFHSAMWPSDFDWTGKDVVVLGNGCSATQFVPVLAERAKSVTQFARQAHYLAERPNPTYAPWWRWGMRYVPFAMRAYRFYLYALMEKDFAGFDIESGQGIREALRRENERYVKRMAPERYWDALIPRHEIGCKRKVMDTGYLATLWKPNVELIPDDPVQTITASGVVTQSGRHLPADAIVLATGFHVSKMLSPMEILGKHGTSLTAHWARHHAGAAQAYLGTCVPDFPNFFTLMGPNTVTGHHSVIYTVECQINFVVRLVTPILLRSPDDVTSVSVKLDAALADSAWLQRELRKLVWSSGCTSWALDPRTGVNIAMYPQYQFWFWWRSVFIPARDFVYAVRGGREERSLVVGGWRGVRWIGWDLIWAVPTLEWSPMSAAGQAISQAFCLSLASKARHARLGKHHPH
ncbi:cyclohexanone 1,2-monooxygenase [Teratosphaeria nubilosa]|uniref:L-ornithine N(5)-monooxygenase [NAD(P)H] n=1 Tax=Teratosphaeria nubilosa TaxID=161662 RepID=A0A6G1LF18_9PEZI|nr:cyclohexanone 1,2-monooxygenase [Teratosphaeria nubilosa]